MSRYLQLCTVRLVLMTAGIAGAQNGADTSVDGMAIKRVIESQLDAFRRDDAETAYSFASPAIRQIFPSSSVFLEMVRRDYPQVYRAKEVTFGGLSAVDGDLTQTVWLTGLDGSRVRALYTMVRAPTGNWLINGCVLLRQDNRSI